MNMNLVNEVTKTQLKKDLPELRSGQTVKVFVRIHEGEKSRIQVFEGVITEKVGGGINESITVRKLSSGIGVERKFPIHSPIVEKIEVVRQGKVRRKPLRQERTSERSPQVSRKDGFLYGVHLFFIHGPRMRGPPLDQ